MCELYVLQEGRRKEQVMFTVSGVLCKTAGVSGEL